MNKLLKTFSKARQLDTNWQRIRIPQALHHTGYRNKYNMPKYEELTYNEMMGRPLEYGSKEREKLRQGFSHQVQIEAGRLGVLEVQYFHPLSVSNLTLTCACCGKTCSSYVGVYKHSHKCTKIHPHEKMVGNRKTAPKPIETEPTLKEDGPQPAKISPQGDTPNWMGEGLNCMGSKNTEGVLELQDIGTGENNHIHNEMSEDTRLEPDIHTTSNTPTKEGCIQKKREVVIREVRNPVQTRSRAKVGRSNNPVIGYV